MEMPQSSEGGMDEMLPRVYDQLRRLANRKMANQAPQTIGATALVHEAYLRLSAEGGALSKEWENRRQFFSAAAEAMRRILIDRTRAKAAQKRGGERVREGDGATEILAPIPDDEIVAVGEALERFAEVDPECAELVKLKYFVGMTWDEIAEITGESTRNLRRKWAYARTWLHAEIKHELKEE